MKRICAWHPVYNSGETLVISEGSEPATHTMCSDCAVKYSEELKMEGKR